MEKFAMEQALRDYTTAYINITLDKKTEQAVCLIIGELSYKLGDEGNARKFLFSAKTNTDGNTVLANLADDRLMELKDK